jgi:hypothetical protein
MGVLPFEFVDDTQETKESPNRENRS